MIPKGTANTVWRLAGIDLAARKGVCAKHTHTPFVSHTALTHTTLSHTHNFVTDHLSLTTLSHTILWQAWHLATSTFVSRGTRGTYGPGLALVARLGAAGRR